MTEACVRSFGFSAPICDVLVRLPDDAAMALAATTAGLPPSMLFLVGPTSHLVLVETGCVTMGDVVELTCFGAAVADAARQVVEAHLRGAAAEGS